MNSTIDRPIHNLVVVVVAVTVAEPVPPLLLRVWDLVALLKPTESFF
jgi:hypothetical protein